MHRCRPTVLGLLLLVSAATACANDGAGSTSSAPSSAPASTMAPEVTLAAETTVDTTPTDTTPTDTTPADTTPTDAPGAGSEFCDVNDQLDTGGEAALSNEATPADVQAFFEVLFPQKLAEMKAAAPGDLADDMDILGAGFTSLGELIADNEWDLAASFADPALGELLDDPAYVAAGSAVDAYCGE